jgi:hypothetical protein
MADEVKLSPGWLLRDVRVAAARLDPSQRQSGRAPSGEGHVAERRRAEPNRPAPQAQRLHEAEG